MLDLGVFANGTVRGAALAQVGTAIAMASVMFGLILHFQYAYGWSPLRAGLANLPMIVTMVLATPITELMVKRLGARLACLVGAALMTGALAGLAWGVEHGYAAIAVAMVVLTIGLRTVMTICAVALVEAMPENRTSIGTALNDTAQEVGSSVGTAVVGTLIAALVYGNVAIRRLVLGLGGLVLRGGEDYVRRARGPRRRDQWLGRAHPHRLAGDRRTALTGRLRRGSSRCPTYRLAIDW